jgi:hypothetical protein
MTKLEEEVDEYLKGDRQWFRQHRMANARYMHGRANTRREREFWEMVMMSLADR